MLYGAFFRWAGANPPPALCFGAFVPPKSEDFNALGKNNAAWDPYQPPGNALSHKKDFLGAFWPWFKAATLLLKVCQQ